MFIVLRRNSLDLDAKRQIIIKTIYFVKEINALLPPSLSGCGVKKISAVNMKASQYVPIHSKQIRGLAFNRQNDSLMLSASLDNTIKLTR